jgi:hypothetical protein
MSRSHRTLVLASATAFSPLAAPALAQDRATDFDRVHETHMRGWDGADRGWSNDDRRDWRSGSDRRERWSDRRSSDDDEGDARRDGRSARSGASFVVRSGDTRLAVRCSPQESMRACVEAATTLLDRARTAEQRPGAPTPPATAP